MEVSAARSRARTDPVPLPTVAQAGQLNSDELIKCLWEMGFEVTVTLEPRIPPPLPSEAYRPMRTVLVVTAEAGNLKFQGEGENLTIAVRRLLEHQFSYLVKHGLQLSR